MSQSKPRVMVVEDDADLAGLLVEELETEGYQARSWPAAEPAIEAFDDFEPDLVISDLQLPGMDGMALLRHIGERPDGPGLLMISAFGTVNRAVEALKAGADNFLTKPLDMDHLTLCVERLLAHRKLQDEVRRFRQALKPGDYHGMVGNSPSMRGLFERIGQIARADGPVLISGESGTGKDLVARALHAESGRSDKAFLAVNCAGIPPDLLESEFFGHAAGAFSGADKERPGLFREADGGTLFLDEIGEMPGSLQAKLLRALQDGAIRPVGTDREQSVDVRLVAATNVDLPARVEAGDFRDDLYYRLETFSLVVPPLRDRGEDIDLLAMQFIEQFAAARQRPARGMTAEALAAIRDYPWPGNVRELRNIMERAVTFCNGEEIAREHLPDRILNTTRLPPESSSSMSVPDELLAGDLLPSLEEMRARYVRYVLERVNGNKRRAAALLGVGRRSLYRWLDDTDPDNS